MLDYQHLAILREVDRSGSVTAAAERLNVSQSALSHMIRKVEERYGVKLWLKQGRGLRFTPGSICSALPSASCPRWNTPSGFSPTLPKGGAGPCAPGWSATRASAG